MTFHYGSLGMMRAYPRLLGLPDALVEADIRPAKGVFMITPPPSETLLSRAGRALGALWNEADPAGQEEEIGPDGVDFAHGDDDIQRILVPTGQRIAGCDNLRSMVTTFTEHVQEKFCCKHVAMWQKLSPAAPMELVAHVGGFGVDERYVFPLTVGEREVGRVEVDLPAHAFGQPMPAFEGLLPWLALGLDRFLKGTVSPKDAAARWRNTWDLTERQLQVLDLLLQGASNKEIGNALGTSPKTVEFHIRQLLKKSQTDCRTALVARILGAKG